MCRIKCIVDFGRTHSPENPLFQLAGLVSKTFSVTVIVKIKNLLQLQMLYKSAVISDSVYIAVTEENNLFLLM